MKRIYYFAFAGMMLFAVSCTNNNNKTDDQVTTEVTEDSMICGDTVETVENAAIPTDSPTVKEDTTANEPQAVKEEAKPAKGNKQVDKLLKLCNNDIQSIKWMGYEDGKPSDPADLQFSDVRTFIRNLRLNLEKLEGLESEMSDSQKAKFKDVQKKANKIFNDIPF